MFRNTFLVFISTILLSFFLSSCNETTILENKISNGDEKIFKKDNEGDLLKEAREDVKIIGYKIVIENGKEKKVPIYDGNPNSEDEPKALNCDYYSRYVYEFSHYEPKNGKYLGIMNQRSDLKSPSELHNTWGFNGYFVHNSAQKTDMINIGYDYNNIMVGIGVSGTSQNHSINIPGGTYAKYYLDEPKENGILTEDDVLVISGTISNLNAQAKLFMGSYQDWSWVESWYSGILQNTSNTRMMCDQYYDGYPWYGHDQTSYWTWFKNTYGSSRVTSHWMHILIDGIQGDFNLLFNKANNLGINTLWLFAGNANNSYPGINESLTAWNYNNYIQDFCLSAFNKGWLRRFVIKYKYMYHCPEYFGDPCYCDKNDNGWELAWIQYMGIVESYP